jgi:hypothetical protein
MSPASGRRAPAAASILSLLAALLGCSPALDWREVRPAGSGVTALFPCRPDLRERRVPIAGADRKMQLHSCDAAGATFSLAVVDGAEPAAVDSLLAAMKASVVGNLGGQASAGRPFMPPGATPNPSSALVRVTGRLPDGRQVVGGAAFFVHGTRVYQATAIGEALAEDAIGSFFAAIKLTP